MRCSSRPATEAKRSSRAHAGPPSAVHEGTPLLVATHRDADPLVLALATVRVVGRRTRLLVAPARRHPPGGRVGQEGIADQVGLGLDGREIDMRPGPVA